MNIDNVKILETIQKYGPLTVRDLYNLLSINTGKSHKIKAQIKKLKSRGKIITRGGLLQLPRQKSPQKSKVVDRQTLSDDFNDIIGKYKIRKDFPAEVIAEANKNFSITPKELSKRMDFRNQHSITIDGEDAKDLDDAVFLEKVSGGWRLYVHIADVSHYVKLDYALDREAVKRGTSIYLVDKVVPMLPHTLSNGICSLNAHEDRLCLSAVIDLSSKGIIKNFLFGESVIHVAKRYTYTSVAKVLETPPDKLEEEDKPFFPMLKEMEKLALILIMNRFKNGSIDFDVDELQIVCDENSNPIEVRRRERQISHRIIEEFMLKANKAAAKFLGDREGAIYRIHDLPDAEKIKTFFQFMRKLNYNLKETEKVKGTFLQKILNEVKGTKNARVVNTLLLRSMKQAEYHTDNIGHYGLGFKDYTHFTSPIRRYPDLMVHRLIKQKLGITDKIKKLDSKKYLAKIALRCSKNERQAMEAEREIVKIKCARFMKKHLNEKFKGIITGLAEFGIFVQVAPYGIEGLVRSRDLDGTFTFDEDYYIMRGSKGKNYELGNEIEVELVSVNVNRGFIDFKVISTT